MKYMQIEEPVGDISRYSTERPMDILKIVISLDNRTFLVNMEDETKVNENDISGEIVKHSSTFAWWASLNAFAKRLLRAHKRDLESLIFSLDEKARHSLTQNGLKVTEQAVKSWLMNNTTVQRLGEEVTKLEDAVEYTDVLLKTLDHRRDMLKELARLRFRESVNP